MKRLLIFCFLILTALTTLSAQNTNPYWTAVNTPEGGGKDELFVTNDGICYNFNRRSGLVYRSADMALHWDKLNIPERDEKWPDTAIIIGTTGNLYLIRADNNNVNLLLERSQDLGNTWTLINPNLPASILIETRAGSLIALRDNLIYRSTDGGLNWTIVSNAAEPNQFQRINEWQPGILTNWQDGVFNKKLWISPDDGITWTLFSTGLPAKGVNSMAVVNKDTFVASADSFIYRSLNGGGDWEKITPVANAKISSLLALPSGRILMFDDKRDDYFFSDDFGLTWTLLPSQAGRKPPVLSLVLPDGSLLARNNISNGTSIWRSSDGAVSWTMSSAGIDLPLINQIKFLNDSTLLAMTHDGVAKSEDWGTHWTNVLTDLESYYGPWFQSRLADINADTFAITISKRVKLTLDGGITFSDITPDSPAGTIQYCAYHIQNQQIVCWDFSDLYTSDDLGVNWVKKANGAVVDNVHCDFIYHPSGKVYAWSANKQIFRSDDGGGTWTPIEPPSFDPASSPLHPVLNVHGSICVFGSAQDQISLLAVSHDGGNSWIENRMPIHINSGERVNFHINSAGHIFLTYYNKITPQQIYCSLDDGASWFSVPRPAGYYSDFTTMAFSPDEHLYIAAGGCLCAGTPSIYRTTNSTLFGGYVRGKVLQDGDADCSTADAQNPLQWPVKIEGEETYYALPDEAGAYQAFVSDTGAYQVSARQPNSVWWDVCEGIQTIHLDTLLAADTADFSGRALMECPLMQVDVATSRLLPCFDNLVHVQYCNIGTEPADSAWVEIELDPYLTIVSAELPYESIGSGLVRFNLGPVQPGSCGQFQFSVYLDCDSTVIGQTHCILAHAWPDTLCTPVAGWSGANIEAEAHCLGDTIQLILKNTGTGISQHLEYIIIEDQIVLDTGGNIYEPGEALQIDMPAQGRTWRIESQQEPGHPFSTLAIAFTEGCDGFNSLGFINQFTVNGIRPAWDRFCLENSGSFDPNGHQGFPFGYGPENRIRPGQDLEYLIRFQNLGADTAFTVVIRDSLSTWLDPASIHPGAASHPYSWTLSGQGVLTVTFDNILLPNKKTNPEASRGFINFRIAQQPGLPLGTQIEHAANVSFDLNAPIRTHPTLHTVGLDDVSGIDDPLSPTRLPPEILVSPNPAGDYTIFKLNGGAFRQHRLTLTDGLGRMVWQSPPVSGNQYIFHRKGLPAGVYICRVENVQGRPVGSSKVIMK